MWRVRGPEGPVLAGLLNVFGRTRACGDHEGVSSPRRLISSIKSHWYRHAGSWTSSSIAVCSSGATTNQKDTLGGRTEQSGQMSAIAPYGKANDDVLVDNQWLVKSEYQASWRCSDWPRATKHWETPQPLRRRPRGLPGRSRRKPECTQRVTVLAAATGPAVLADRSSALPLLPCLAPEPTQ